MMKMMLSKCSVDCIDCHNKDQIHYRLLRLTEDQGRCLYAIWIFHAENQSMEDVGEEESAAKTLFERAVDGGLSPLHLHDWLSDLRNSQETSEFLSILG